MTLDLQQSYFELFNMPKRFRLDEAALEAAYHELHTRAHPDRHAHLPEAERRRSMQWATRINEGFRTLKKPLSRAQYMLELAGVDPGLETNTAMAPEFLMEQMEWREAIEEATQARDADALEQLYMRLRQRSRATFERLERLFDVDDDLPGAAETVRRLMFAERLQRDIDEALEAMED